MASVPAYSKEGDRVHVVVESPRGSRIKFRFDPELRGFIYERALPRGLVYPYDWGFVPHTEAPDGDPVDALVLSEEATFPGIIVPCRPIAVLEVMEHLDEGGRRRNDRVVCRTVARDVEGVMDVRLTPSLRAELEAFFVEVVRFGKKQVEIKGWAGAGAARTLIRHSLVVAAKPRRSRDGAARRVGHGSG